MLALVDGVRLDADDAKRAMRDAARWLLNGALDELAGGEHERRTPAAAEPRVS